MGFFIPKTKILFGLIAVIFFSALFAFAQNPAFEIDSQAGPTIQKTTMPITSGGIGTVFTITTQASDVSGISLVSAHIQHPDETTIVALTLYDDGTHNDGVANDGTFGNSWNSTGQSIGAYFVDIEARDGFNNSSNQENGASFTLTAAACIDDCAIGEFGCMGMNNEWTCGEAGDGDACLDKIIIACAGGKICCSTSCQFPICANNNDCNDGNDCTIDTCNSPSSCFANCSNNPIVACISGDNCCPAGCTNPPDADCGACVPTCTTGPGCSTFAITNAFITGNVCCGVGEFCYDCDFSFCWNGSNCITDVPPIADSRVGNSPSPTGNSVIVTVSDIVYFDGSTYSMDFDGTIVKYEWDFEGDGTYDWSSTTTGITMYIYGTAGLYPAKLQITDDCGDISFDNVNVMVNPPWVTALITSPSDDGAFGKGDSITFDCLITGGTLPFSYSWDSNIDRNIGNSQAFNKNDLSIGDHTITLTVTDAVPAISTDSINIHIPPDSFDWRNVSGQNWMTSVKDQGMCGSCWAFASLGSVEAKYNIEQNSSSLNIDLSEQYLVSDCCHGNDCIGGGCMFDYLQSNGVPTENCYSYFATNSACPATCDDGSAINLWKTNGLTLLCCGAAIVQDSLIRNGPLFVTMRASSMGDSGRVDDDGCVIYTCGGGAVNHGIVLVGYDNINQYWIIKNSWGASDPTNPCLDGYYSLDYATCNIQGGCYTEGVSSP